MSCASASAGWLSRRSINGDAYVDVRPSSIVNKIITSILALLFAARICAAEPSPPKTHASREAAVQLLRQEGILSGNTRVVDANWGGTFWIISLHHPDGKVTNWTVDAAAKDYSYICQH